MGVVGEGQKADAVARDAISAREVFIFWLFVCWTMLVARSER